MTVIIWSSLHHEKPDNLTTNTLLISVTVDLSVHKVISVPESSGKVTKADDQVSEHCLRKAGHFKDFLNM